jgi:coproporphyrinogen III oxidase
VLETLQRHFVAGLEQAAAEGDGEGAFELVTWLRDGGSHGGGQRYTLKESAGDVFNAASVNVSGIHYDDLPEKRLLSADALSTIIHPSHPRAPSVHLHFSWTELRTGAGYWRMMADLNPSLEDSDGAARFAECLRHACPSHYEEAEAQGAKYFYIPALGRHRGATHFYLEEFNSGDFASDAELAESVCRQIMDCYVALLTERLRDAGVPSADELKEQLHYHTLYLFQVVTLDRGTTSGLLVHDQNDLGIMSSIPARVDRTLLSSWAEKVQAPQDKLVASLVDALLDETPSRVTDEVRLALASAVRQHYKAHPEALHMQASGNTIPPTVANHQSGEE